MTVRIGLIGAGGMGRAHVQRIEEELAGGKVVVAPPRGYCVDPRSLRKGLTGGFALIASCNSLTGDYSGADVEPVLMTVQVQPGLLTRDLPGADDMATAMAPARALRKVDGDGLTQAFADVTSVARECRFGDCTHGDEPGCAVRNAVANGAVDERRVESFLALRNEAEATERRRDEQRRRADDKARTKTYRAVQREQRRRRGE